LFLAKKVNLGIYKFVCLLAYMTS